MGGGGGGRERERERESKRASASIQKQERGGTSASPTVRTLGGQLGGALDDSQSTMLFHAG